MLKKEITHKNSMIRSTLILLIANFIPLFGVLFFSWDIFLILLLYWSESAVVGFYTILRLLKVGLNGASKKRPLKDASALLYIPLFIFHYGVFMAAHLFFIFVIFIPGEVLSLSYIFLSLSNLLTDWTIILSLVSLFVSHGVSFFYNFVGQKEFGSFGNKNAKKLMIMPYKRILIMHITLVLGGFVIFSFGSPIFALIILIIAKIAIDLYAHIKEHKSYAGRS